MRLQHKFVALFLPTGILAAALLLILVHRAVHSIVMQGIHRAAQARLETAGAETLAGFKDRSEARLLPALQSLQKQSDAFYAVALDPQGVVLAHTSIVEKGKTYRDPANLKALQADHALSIPLSYRGEPLLEVSVPVWAAKQGVADATFLLAEEPRAEKKIRLGTMKLGVPLKPAIETARQIVKQVLAIILLIGPLFFGVVLFLIRGVLRPVGSLMAAIARIGQGRYAVSVPISSNDELGELAASFNNMSAELTRTTVSKEYVEGILQNMIDLLFVTDSHGRLETINLAASQTLGYPPDELTGRPLAFLFHDPPPLLDEDRYQGLLAAGPIKDLELSLKTKSGDRVPALFAASVLRSKEGRFQGLVGVAKDITERKRTEEALLASKAAAEAASKELEAFSYSVAHDLRAPLRTVDGFSQILLKQYSDKLDAEGQDYLKRMCAGSRRMGQLIDDLLNLSRVTRSKVLSQRVDLTALAREIAAELRKAPSDRKVDFVIAEGLSNDGDLNLLRVTLTNLLANAWKYTGKRPGARIEFGQTRREGKTVYFVRDNGAGFDMAFSKKLFTPFNRLHSAHEFEGTGIGLAIVSRIIDRHAGRIWGEGAVGKGAVFYFTLWEGKA